MAKILMIVTSHGEIDAGHPTGLWYEEYAIPYRAFVDAGFGVVTASPRGGKVPVDPRSLDGVTPDPAILAELENSITALELGDTAAFSAVFLPGGHGTMFDLAQGQQFKALISEFDAQGKIVAAVCHGPAVFVDAIRAAEPRTLVAGRRITCFTDEEERTTKLDSLMPFLLASKLREQGAEVVENPPWSDHVEVDGNWVTGQNPQSSASTARATIEALKALSRS
ncbi:MAG: type 1 glutamine amidotransferase domain-containing protein [Candidatus Eremiobacteraeota bacterium]|nr:type 1 glutamine amidotransferase domain-containing protein [Candidatus Eremiobacteraeota bacterium]